MKIAPTKRIFKPLRRVCSTDDILNIKIIYNLIRSSRSLRDDHRNIMEFIRLTIASVFRSLMLLKYLKEEKKEQGAQLRIEERQIHPNIFGLNWTRRPLLVFLSNNACTFTRVNRTSQ